MKPWVALGLLIVLFAFPIIALADMAPPAQPPGSNPEPGTSSTQVRMLAEKVLIDVRPGSGDSRGKAQVTADFTMRNLGSEKERMAARFPISANDGYYGLPEIQDLQVQINGKNVPTRRIQGEDPYYRGNQAPWAEFDVTFPPDKNVDVRITYTLEGSGWPPFVTFNYILSTGAGWKDSIGRADLIVRLPYEANSYNVLLNQGDWSQTTPGAVLEGNTILWHYENLEPTTDDNLAVELVMPSEWQKVLKERANVEKNPKDGEAWGRLGKKYKELAFMPKYMREDPGGQGLYQLSIEAYEKCLGLKPNDAEWHVGLADLYWRHYDMTHWGSSNDPSNDYSDLEKASALLKRAIEINPTSPKALEILDYFEAVGYVGRQGDAYDFLLLTATPAAQVSPALLPTQQPEGRPTASTQPGQAAPSETPAPTEPAQVTPTPAAISQAEAITPSPARSLDPTPTAPAAETAASSGGLKVCGLPLGLSLVVGLGAMVQVGRRRR